MLYWFMVQENFAQLWDGSPSVKYRPAAIKRPWFREVQVLALAQWAGKAPGAKQGHITSQERSP